MFKIDNYCMIIKIIFCVLLSLKRRITYSQTWTQKPPIFIFEFEFRTHNIYQKKIIIAHTHNTTSALFFKKKKRKKIHDNNTCLLNGTAYFGPNNTPFDCLKKKGRERKGKKELIGETAQISNFICFSYMNSVSSLMQTKCKNLLFCFQNMVKKKKNMVSFSFMI